VSRLQLELFELFPQFFKTVSWNIPESGKGLPDLIAEVLFQVDCYRRLQTPEGGVRGGIESSEHPVPGETSWLESQMVLTYAPDPWCSFMYAGVAARTAYVLRQLDAARAPEYEQSALKAMNWGEAEYARWLKGPDYPKVRRGAKSEVARERNLAAVELYRLTRGRKWHDLLLGAIRPEPSQKASFAGQFDAAFVYARLDDSLADPAVKRQAIEAILGEAEQVMRVSKGNAFGITARYLGPYSSAFSNPASPELIRAHALTGRPEYLAAILRAAQFSSGANPMNITMTTGVGHDWPRNILHEDMKHTGQEAPIGITVFGPADHPRPDWFLTRLQKECTPPAMEWPLVEGYFDVYLWAPVCEYTVDSSMIATEYAWGYLAARK
jgi:endoglucanase